MTSAKSSLPLPQRLLLYSLGAGAATVAASAHGAAADVVATPYTGTTGGTYYFNLQNTVAANNGSSSTGEQFEFYKGIQKAGAQGANSTNYVIATESKLGGSNGTTATNYVLKLGVGATIGSGTNFTTSGMFNNYYAATYTPTGGTTPVRQSNDGSGVGDWKAGTTTTGRGFVGLRILTTTGKTDYGFADLTITNYTGNTGTFVLNGYAYDPTGAAITTFAIPEPGSTTALLVAGAAGAAALRRRRKATATTGA